MPVAACRFDGDHEPATAHFGAVMGAGDAAAIVGIVTLMQRPFPNGGGPTDLQLRGMAVAADHQRRGVGGRLLRACHDHAVHVNATRLWCNARTPAVPFYGAHGWRTVGDEFNIPTAGPHLRMVWGD